jgi:hypothetical protein
LGLARYDLSELLQYLGTSESDGSSSSLSRMGLHLITVHTPPESVACNLGTGDLSHEELQSGTEEIERRLHSLKYSVTEEPR